MMETTAANLPVEKKKTAFCLDLDGTVLNGEVLPYLADHINLYDEINLLTSLTMQGMISFEKSFRLRVKLLCEIPVTEARRLIREIPIDPYIKAFLQEHKEDCYIVTGNLDVWIRELVESIGCGFYSSQGISEEDRLCDLKSILRKENVIMDLKTRYENVVAVGDGMNDAMMLQEADVGIAYCGYREPVEGLIRVATYVVYSGRGLCNILNTL